MYKQNLVAVCPSEEFFESCVDGDRGRGNEKIDENECIIPDLFPTKHR